MNKVILVCVAFVLLVLPLSACGPGDFDNEGINNDVQLYVPSTSNDPGYGVETEAEAVNTSNMGENAIMNNLKNGTPQDCNLVPVWMSYPGCD